MAEFHFVEDYERLVARLVEQYPMDEAMSYAVGGGYEAIGEIEADIVQWAGLKEGMTLFDLGCGSGRLAHAISKRIAKLEFIGARVVQSLLRNHKSTQEVPVRAQPSVNDTDAGPLRGRVLGVPAFEGECNARRAQTASHLSTA